MPVDAPLGTAARKRAESVHRSTSTVGLPAHARQILKIHKLRILPTSSLKHHEDERNDFDMAVEELEFDIAPQLEAEAIQNSHCEVFQALWCRT